MELIDSKLLKPSAYNPREADEFRLDLIELSLRKLGFLLPLYVSNNYDIISGHQRHLVAVERLGLQKVPVEYVDAKDLDSFKVLNLIFNRATNDMDADKGSHDLKQTLLERDVLHTGESLKDVKEFFPCMNALIMDIKPLLKQNKGKWNQYAKNLNKTLFGKKIKMPLVVDPELNVINGIGRLELHAIKKDKTVNVVKISKKQAEFARLMLNYLTMDFAIHKKYEDLLRYNSFRRPRTNRRGNLGKGFYVGAFGNINCNKFNIDRESNKWINSYGRNIIDFGAGRGDDANIMRGLGVEVLEFEPYRLKPKSSEIDIKESRLLALNFLKHIGSGKKFSSVFISSVFNSVPFRADREKIIRIVAALSTEYTCLHLWCMNTQNERFISVAHGNYSYKKAREIKMYLDYEEGITLGEYTTKPKVQKYHTAKELFEVVSLGYENVTVKKYGDSLLAVASNPKPVSVPELSKALEFEFDMPYPNNQRMGLVKEAKKAFSKRLGVQIQ